MAEKIWKKFEKDLKKVVKNIDTTVLKKLKSNFMDTPLDFLKSEEFDLIAKDTIEKISYNKLKIYLHLLDLKKSLKSATSVKRRCTFESAVEVKKRKIDEEECIIENLVATVKDEEEEFLDYYTGCTTSAQPETIPPVEKVDEHNLKIEKYISKLENVLQATKNQIERLEEEELTLDDLDQENNSFIMLDKLKTHCVKVWRKICKLRNSKSKLHHRSLRTFTFSGTAYPDLNVIIEDFVKMKKFPDYHDIKVVVTTFAKEKSLKMSAQKISELSVDIFTQIGNKLKKLRISEFNNYFGNHLTDQVKASDNPILKDDNLKKVLLRNFAIGQIKLDEVLDKYSRIDNGTNEDSASDISTEHSVNTDNDDIEDNLEEINISALPNKSNIEKDDMSSSNGDTAEEAVEEISRSPSVNEPVQGENQPKQSEIPNENHICTIAPVSVPVPCPESNDVIDCDTVTIDEPVASTQKDELVPCATNELPIDDQMIQSRIDTDEQIKEMECHTFKFNIDQIRQGEHSVMFPATITIDDSSDDDNSGTSDDNNGDLEQNNSAYSSKLDDFCVGKSKITQIVDTGICICIEDSDEDNN